MTKILVIEDETPVRLNILELLEAEEFEVVGAENGMIGVLWALEYVPDLIVSDVMMPELDGYGVLATLREDPATATIPFIFLSAKADKADLRQGMELGADDYLTKPFTRSELLQSIIARLEKQAAMVQQYTPERPKILQTRQPPTILEGSIPEDIQGEMYEPVPVSTGAEPLQSSEFDPLLSKLKIAIDMLKRSSPGAPRDRCLEVLHQAWADEIALINQVPNLQDFLPREDIELLQECNLIKL